MQIGCITEQELTKFVHNLDNLPHIYYRPCCAAAVKLARQNCTHARKHLFDITAKTIGWLKTIRRKIGKYPAKIRALSQEQHYRAEVLCIFAKGEFFYEKTCTCDTLSLET